MSGEHRHRNALRVRRFRRSAFDWQGRPFNGVRLFLKRFPACRSVTVVTRDAAGEADVNGARVEATPLWKYLLRE